MPAEVARKNRLVTFVTHDEYLALTSIANETGDSMSGVCHRILVGYLRQRKDAVANQREPKPGEEMHKPRTDRGSLERRSK